MGKGKGEPEYWAAVIKPGTVLYEIGGVSEEVARSSASPGWPTRCRSRSVSSAGGADDPAADAPGVLRGYSQVNQIETKCHEGARTSGNE